MKITILVGNFDAKRHSLLYELALDLVKKDNRVTILTGFPSRGITEENRKHYIEHPTEELDDNIIVKRVGSTKGEGSGLFIRMVKYLFLTSAIYKEAKKTESDVYFIYSTPPFLGWIGTKLVKYAPTLYNAQDLFPDTLAQIKHLSEKNPLMRFLRYKEKKVYQFNSKVVTISEDMKNTLIQNGCPEDKIDVIYNWVDTKNVHHVNKSDNTLMDELNIDKSKFIVSYAGTIGLFQGLETVIDAAKIIQAKSENIRFVLIGDGSYKKKLLSRIKNEGISNIEVFPFQPISRVSEIYSIGDLELVTIGNGITKTSLPSKTWQIMAAGSPILAVIDKPSCLSNIIEENKLGYSVEPENPEKLAEAILQANKEKACLSDMGIKSRSFAETNVSREEQTKKYVNIILNLTKLPTQY